MQLEQIAVAGTAGEKTLLANLTAKNPDASYIELLRLFKVRRPDGRPKRSLHLVYVAWGLLRVARAPLLAAAAPDPDLGCPHLHQDLISLCAHLHM